MTRAFGRVHGREHQIRTRYCRTKAGYGSICFTKLACKHFILRSVLIDNRALIAIFSIVSFFSRQEGYLVPIQVCTKSGTSRYWVVAKLVRPCMCPKARGFPIEQGW